MKQKRFYLIMISLIVMFALGGCVPNKDKPTNNTKNISNNQSQSSSDTLEKTPVSVLDQLKAQSKIKKFESLKELQSFLEQGNITMYDGYGGFGVGATGAKHEEIKAAPSNSAKSSADDMLWGGYEEEARAQPGLGGVSEDFSKTNVQVEGVDESDIIKTDGKYIYAVVKNNLYIVDAYPAKNSEVLAKIEFKSRPNDIYINGENGKAADRLVIYGNDNAFYQTDFYKKFRRRSSFTYLKVFDISDKKNPVQVRDLDFEGTYNNSRMIGDYVYFVTSNHDYYYIEDEPILPRIIEDGEVISNFCEKGVRCIMPSIYYFDIPYSNYNFTSVNSININDEDEPIQGDVYLLSGNQNMYVSLNNIYITYTKYISEYQLEMEVMKELIFPRLSSKDKEKILNIESAPYYILTPDEKRRKIEQIIERFGMTLTDEEQNDLEDEQGKMMKQKYKDISKELEKTVIHKIGISKGNLEYKTSGEVTGQVLNQFSMDESGGYFRIATTKNRTWSKYDEGRTESYNNLFVLDDDLKVVGSVEKLAEGERIYSVRFMQNRAYMVTFRQTDPLFVIDLTNPKEPKVLGKLKIPGFSNYLHPYDNKTLIGLGKDTQETEWGGVTTRGLKLSLFDVSDVSDPKEIDTYVMGDSGSDSIALHDHKAFLLSRDKNLLVIPVSIRESFNGRSWGSMTFSGAAVFYIDENGFKLKGKIDHSDGGKTSQSDYWQGYNYYDNTVKRSLYIDDTLVTFSNNYLMMHDIDELKLEKSLRLKKLPNDKEDDFTIIN